MEQFKAFASKYLPIPIENIDTDQIIPARFLKTTTSEGLGRLAFYDWRYNTDGLPNPEFVLNKPEAEGAKILVAGKNFGCGSSREHAPWALHDAGFRAIISSGFADIFRNNALKNGLLPIQVPESTLQELLSENRGLLGVDLKSQTLTISNGTNVEFPIAPFAKHCLLHGIDELGYLLNAQLDIDAYEAYS